MEDSPARCAGRGPLRGGFLRNEGSRGALPIFMFTLLRTEQSNGAFEHEPSYDNRPDDAAAAQDVDSTDRSDTVVRKFERRISWKAVVLNEEQSGSRVPEAIWQPALEVV